jgi:MoaA/NifB/PqqE/SkfB family radical SAM enzyme
MVSWIFLIRFALRFLWLNVFRCRRPLLAGFAITDRCPYRCAYCLFANRGMKDLTLDEIRHAIDKLHALGLMVVQFTGGEPFIREDMSDIIRYAKSKGLVVMLSSSGFNIDKHAGILRDINSIQISLDGTEDVHDALRGKGSYATALKSAKIIQSAGGTYFFRAVLTRKNAHCIEHLLHVAAEYQTEIAFQPMWGEQFSTDDAEKNLALPEDDLHKLIDQIIVYKKQGLPVRDSVYALRTFQRIFNTRFRMNACAAGRIYFRVESDGALHPCCRQGFFSDKHDYLNVVTASVGQLKEYFSSVKPYVCDTCPVSMLVELNGLYNLDINALGSLFELFRCIVRK